MRHTSVPNAARMAGAVACGVLAGWATAARAQTDYSLRSRALAVELAGIVDDPITDAYLNPARLGGLGGRFVYAGALPGRAFDIVFPDRVDVAVYRPYIWETIGSGARVGTVGYSPLVAVSGWGSGRWRAVVSAEAFESGTEDGRSSLSVYESEKGIPSNLSPRTGASGGGAACGTCSSTLPSERRSRGPAVWAPGRGSEWIRGRTRGSMEARASAFERRHRARSSRTTTHRPNRGITTR